MRKVDGVEEVIERDVAATSVQAGEWKYSRVGTESAIGTPIGNEQRMGRRKMPRRSWSGQSDGSHQVQYLTARRAFHGRPTARKCPE